MPKLVKRQVLLAKIETAYNTDPVPAAATDAVLVENFQWSFTGQRMNEQPVVKPTLGAKKHLYGGTLMQVTFDVAIRGSGTAGTPPEYGPILRACGMGETIVASTSVTYKPVSSAIESCTIYFYEDGQLYKMTGCRGTFSGNLTTGQAGKLNFTLTGHFVEETDTALVSPSYDSTVSPVVISAGFTVDSYSAIINALTFDIGATVATPPNINAADGYGEITITGRDVTGSFDPEKVSKTTYDFITKWQNGSVMSLTTGVIGAIAGNKYQISMPGISYRDVSPGDRDGIRTYEIPFGAAESVGDDEISIVLT